MLSEDIWHTLSCVTLLSFLIIIQHKLRKCKYTIKFDIYCGQLSTRRILFVMLFILYLPFEVGTVSVLTHSEVIRFVVRILCVI